MKPMDIFVGIDWGDKTHTVCVVNSEKEVLLEQEVAHDGDAVMAFVESVMALAGGEAHRVVAAMEAPRGTMVESLLERGVVAYHINPKQLDRLRDRHSVAGAKDDDLDAFVLATSMITDINLFRKIDMPSTQLLKLQALTRAHQSLTHEVVALGNQGRNHLRAFYPQLIGLGTWHQEPWMWDIFEVAPTPESTGRLRLATVRAILKRHKIRRHTAAEVVSALRATPLPLAPGVAEAGSQRVLMSLPVHRAALQQLKLCDKKIKELLEAKPSEEGEVSPDNMQHDAAILLSLPGIGFRVCAVLLSEAPTVLRERNYNDFRSLAGSAPVSRRTGGRKNRPQVSQRRACNPRLREATYHWARVAAQCEPRAKKHYTDLRSKGHSHGRAVRGVSDRLFKVMMSMLSRNEFYDAARRHRSDALDHNAQKAA